MLFPSVPGIYPTSPTLRRHPGLWLVRLAVVLLSGWVLAHGSLAVAAPGPQSITFNNPGSQNFGTTPTLTANATSGLAVEFSTPTPSVCTITLGGVLNFVAAGSCTVNADQPGDGAWLAASTVSQTFTVLPITPGAPTSVVATAGDTQAGVAFVAPINMGGSAITGYTVTVSPPDVAPVTGPSSPVIVFGLTNGQPYTFTVAANNLAGTGIASAPSAPINPAATQTITFAAPGAQNFGTTPTFNATADSGLNPVFSSSTTGVCTITTLGALTFVTAGSCTINADQPGNSTYLPAAQVTRTFTVNAVVPGPPTMGSATAGNARTVVAFAAPAFTGGAPITGYTVTATTVPGGVTSTATGAASPITVTGLSNGTTYAFRVSAMNTAGTGALSAASANATPVAPDEPPAPPAKEDVTLAPGSSGTLSTPGSATLNAGSALAVQAAAAGGSITPPSAGTATVHLGGQGGRVTLAQALGGGRALVLAPAAGSGAMVLGLASGSLSIGTIPGTAPGTATGSGQGGQVLLDVGAPGAGSTASGRQAVAGPGGARILADRAGDGSLTVQVLEDSVLIPCAGPCVSPATTITLLAGEKAHVNRQGLVQTVALLPAPLPTPVPAGLQLPSAPADLSGTTPARTPGASLLAQANAALQALFGPAVTGHGQQALGNALWTLPDGSTLGLLPLALPHIDLNTPDGATLRPDGTLGIAWRGVVQTFGPAPVDLHAALQALQALVPAAKLRVGATGTWRIDASAPGPNGLALALAVRPGWLASPGGAPAQALRFELDAAGNLWLLQANGLQTPVLPALAEPRALQALLVGADPLLQWQVGLDGTATGLLLGQAYRFYPQPVLQRATSAIGATGAEAFWLERLQGQLLLHLRLADGLVQTVVVQ